jgi:hypothetical protein
LGTGGKICVYTHRAMDLVVDVTGSFPGKPTKVDLRNAVGFAVRERSTVSGFAESFPETSTSSELLTVAADGSVALAFPGQSVPVIGLHVEGRRAFLRLDPNVPNEISGRLCLLAEVDLDTEIVGCVTPAADAGAVYWELSPFRRLASVHRPVQVDDSGAVHYLASVGGTGVPTLQRTKDGITTSVVDPALAIVYDFLVLRDGSVIVSGQNRAGARGVWLRRYLPTGGIQPLASDWTVEFMRTYPDGNAYIGTGYEVRRFFTTTGQFDSRRWIAKVSEGNTATHDADVICAGVTRPSAFCSYPGRLDDTYTTPTGTVVAVTGNELVTHYPTVRLYEPPLATITAAAGAGNKIAVAGNRTGGIPGLAVVDLVSGNATQVLPTTAGIEIFRLGVISKTNTVMFDGLRYSDGRYVLGKVKLADLSYEITPLRAGKLIDFVTF